jgi:eukaryotic translation initiation factor 2C
MRTSSPLLMVDVIHDENNFKADQLQTLIYHQSYVFARSSTSVSLRNLPHQVYLTVDPAVYYAHLAGNRARVRDESFDTDDAATSVSATSQAGEISVMPLRPMHVNMAGGARAMWFL